MKQLRFDKSILPSLAACLLLPVYLELALHLFVYRGVSARIVYPLLFALAAGFALFALVSLLPKRAGGIVLCVLTGIFVLYFEIQFVYNSIFGEFMSVWQVSFGTTAIANFHQQMLYGIWQAIVPVLVLLLPLPAMIVAVCRGWLRLQRRAWRFPVCAAVLMLALHFGAVGIMRANAAGMFSAYQLYTDAGTATEISIKNIGLLSTTRQECKFLLLGAQPAGETELLAQEGAADGQYDPAAYNIYDIDFEKLSQETEDDALRKLDEYFAAATPTSKNEYTGLLKDYNLITICAESFSDLLIDEERTPALYKLATNGFVFKNYYGSFGSNTTNGEYTMCTGLYPDLTRSKSTASFYASQKNYLPFCLGNEMKERGALTYAYHNYTGEYYSRNVTHPNIGYTFKSATDGLDIALSWPSSDLEMMQQSVADYLQADTPFCAYYMTFSGHYQYNWDNPMSAKNRAVTDGLPYSDPVKAYIACNQELERGLEFLLQALEDAGVADKTVIVLTNDHYPYGLNEQQYNELAGHEVDTVFEKYRNSFLCYVPGLHVEVDTYCSTADILPTLLNLFGLPYDSRLLAGRDVLSPEAHDYAVLSDQSFITPDFAFDASTGTLKRTDGGTDDVSARVEEISAQIARAMQVSKQILDNDYYAHAILGVRNADNTLQEYPYTDIPETFSLGMLDYYCQNGYMDAFSDTVFGFDIECPYAELLETLYRIQDRPGVSGAPLFFVGSSTRTMTGEYQDAVRWAQDHGLISDRIGLMDAFTPLLRKDAAVTLRRYAAMLGCDVTVEEQTVRDWQARYPALSTSETAALVWCFENSIARLDGELDSVFRSADQVMPRYYVMSMVYNFHLIFER